MPAGLLVVVLRLVEYRSGAAEAVVQAQAKQTADFKVLYDRLPYNAAITFIEPFPIGLLVTCISALALRTRGKP